MPSIRFPHTPNGQWAVSLIYWLLLTHAHIRRTLVCTHSYIKSLTKRSFSTTCHFHVLRSHSLSLPMKSPNSPYGGRKSTFGARRTPERVPYSPSSAYSDVSTAGTSSSSGRSRVSVAARSVAGVFVACFTPPETKSSTYSVTDSEEFKAPSGKIPIFSKTWKLKGKKYIKLIREVWQ